MTGRIGVAITTHNRNQSIQATVSNWKKYLPKGAVIVVIDDASDTPVTVTDVDKVFRFDSNVGIPRAKNKCLEILINEYGCEELFLSDDDCWPISSEWWKPYIESPEPHLSYQFFDVKTGRKINDLKLLHKDSKHVAYSDQRGCLLYYHVSVINIVGGFDPIYGRGMYEHGDLADRIHANGLTTWRYADVAGSENLWHSEDEERAGVHERSVDGAERAALVKRNTNIHHNRRARRFKGYVPIIEPTQNHGTLLTCYLTAYVDPQRGIKWDPADLVPSLDLWAKSASENASGAKRVVLTDEGSFSKRDLHGAICHKVENTGINVYYQRWLHIYQYLRENPQDGWVWCTDGTDVEVLRNPLVNLIPGRLYVGYEHRQVGDPWMLRFHPHLRLQKFIRDHRAYRLLNAGVAGGDYFTMLEFSHRMASAYYDLESAKFWSNEKTKPDVGDMALFNMVVYEQFNDRFITGPDIVTEFKKNIDNGTALFRHK